MNKHRGSAFDPADFGIPELTAFEKIAQGINDVIAYANGDHSRAVVRLTPEDEPTELREPPRHRERRRG